MMLLYENQMYPVTLLSQEELDYIRVWLELTQVKPTNEQQDWYRITQEPTEFINSLLQEYNKTPVDQ
jgi:hypothetical protein